MSIKRYSIYTVYGGKGWEKRPSPNGEFVMSGSHDDQVKKFQTSIRELLSIHEPGVSPEEAQAVLKQARALAGIVEPKKVASVH